METNLGFGIKFFKEQKHKEIFDSGKIYSNPISYYRKNEKALGTGRGDLNEGILSVFLEKKPQIKFETEKGETFTGELTNINIPILEEQHIFSFIHLEKEWYEIGENEIRIKIPQYISNYFFENYGNYYSLFSVDSLIHRLNNTILEDGSLAYINHFKVDYVDEKYLSSEERFKKLNELMDKLECLENDYEIGKPFFDEFYKKYMGIKARKYNLEHEMRIILGVNSSQPSTIQL